MNKKKPVGEENVLDLWDDTDDQLEHIKSILDLLWRSDFGDPPLRFEGTISTVAEDCLDRIEKIESNLKKIIKEVNP